MNVADLLIILLLLATLVRGVELGLIQQAFSTAGFIGGILIGGLLQHHFVQPMQASSESRALLSLLVTLGVAFLFLFIGELAGGRLKMRIRATDKRWLERADKIGGGIIAGFTLLVVIWLVAGLVANVPDKTVRRQVRESYIINRLEAVLPDGPAALHRIGAFINPNGFPRVFIGQEPALNTTAALPDVGELQAAAEKARKSTVKLAGRGCGGIVNGSGFIASGGLVVTNAHVVAGVERPTIIDGEGSHEATPIWFDPQLDIAVLRPDQPLGGPALTFATAEAPAGTPGAVLGFPGGGELSLSVATVLDSFTATGRNIYNEGVTRRDVYSIKATVLPGNSGGPLVDREGDVIGVIFAQSTTYQQVGYALTAEEAQAALASAATNNQAVSTGACAS